MRKDYLQKPFAWVVNDIQKAFRHFEAQKIRRVYIIKPGKAEKRPLGIPAIRDRIVQECMRIVLEPILEAQFFAHSYGFRPMRDTAMALERVKFLTFQTDCHWVLERGISKYNYKNKATENSRNGRSSKKVRTSLWGDGCIHPSGPEGRV